MPATAARDQSYRSGGSPGGRTLALVLAAAANLLLILMLLGLAPPFGPRPAERRTVTVTVQPPPRPVVAGTRATRVRRASGGAAPPAARPRPAPARPAATGPFALQGVLMLTPQDYAAADIATLPAHAAGLAAGAGGGRGAGQASGDSDGAGEGPNGQKLYYADWYRRPSNAELDFYLKPGMPAEGWGEVACRTVDRFHVEDCQELGSSPPGSGFARAVREAAWQFLVKPPRIGGQSLVGSWVRIRIDYTISGAVPSRRGG